MSITINGKLKKSYLKWSSMLRRCYDPRHPAYPYYGGRGMEVCDRWRGRDGYANFLADLGEPPTGLTLDRRNNALGYEPANCRWATWKEQAANRRRVGPDPDPNSLRQRAKAAGLAYHVVYQRVKIHQWPIDKALTAPVRPKRNPGRREWAG